VQHECREKRQYTGSTEPFSDHDIAFDIDAVDLEAVLREIKANRANLWRMAPLIGGALMTTTLHRTHVPGAGAIHLIRVFRTFGLG
jgi:hypothetical protein